MEAYGVLTLIVVVVVVSRVFGSRFGARFSSWRVRVCRGLCWVSIPFVCIISLSVNSVFLNWDLDLDWGLGWWGLGEAGECGVVGWVEGEFRTCVAGRYTLHAVLHHLGRRASSGHYITDARLGKADRADKVEGGERCGWRRYDDSSVTQAREGLFG